MSMLNKKIIKLNNKIAKHQERKQTKHEKKVMLKLHHKKDVLIADLRSHGLSIYDNGVYSGLPNMLV